MARQASLHASAAHQLRSWIFPFSPCTEAVRLNHVSVPSVAPPTAAIVMVAVVQAEPLAIPASHDLFSERCSTNSGVKRRNVVGYLDNIFVHASTLSPHAQKPSRLVGRLKYVQRNQMIEPSKEIRCSIHAQFLHRTISSRRFNENELSNVLNLASTP